MSAGFIHGILYSYYNQISNTSKGFWKYNSEKSLMMLTNIHEMILSIITLKL